MAQNWHGRLAGKRDIGEPVGGAGGHGRRPCWHRAGSHHTRTSGMDYGEGDDGLGEMSACIGPRTSLQHRLEGSCDTSGRGQSRYSGTDSDFVMIQRILWV
jgi:hypothetical protein